MAAEFRSRISVRNSEACSKANLGTSATVGIWAGELLALKSRGRFSNAVQEMPGSRGAVIFNTFPPVTFLSLNLLWVKTKYYEINTLSSPILCFRCCFHTLQKEVSRRKPQMWVHLPRALGTCDSSCNKTWLSWILNPFQMWTKWRDQFKACSALQQNTGKNKIKPQTRKARGLTEIVQLWSANALIGPQIKTFKQNWNISSHIQSSWS